MPNITLFSDIQIVQRYFDQARENMLRDHEMQYFNLQTIPRPVKRPKVELICQCNIAIKIEGGCQCET